MQHFILFWFQWNEFSKMISNFLVSIHLHLVLGKKGGVRSFLLNFESKTIPFIVKYFSTFFFLHLAPYQYLLSCFTWLKNLDKEIN